MTRHLLRPISTYTIIGIKLFQGYSMNACRCMPQDEVMQPEPEPEYPSEEPPASDVNGQPDEPQDPAADPPAEAGDYSSGDSDGPYTPPPAGRSGGGKGGKGGGKGNKAKGASGGGAGAGGVSGGGVSKKVRGAVLPAYVLAETPPDASGERAAILAKSSVLHARCVRVVVRRGIPT